MKNFFERLKQIKNIKVIVVAGLCVLTIAIYFLPEKSNNTAEGIISNNTEVTQRTKEEQLESVLSNIKGAGKVSVMITYESGSEIVCASTTETETNTVTEKNESGNIRESETVIENKSPVTVGSGTDEDALIIVEKEPEIKGVIVVAQGAENINVRLNLQKAVETVLQVSPTQVEIFAMN